MSELALKGKAIVITGAGRGLGRAYAQGAANAGGNVLVNDIEPALAAETAALIDKAGGTADAIAADVSDWDQAKCIVDRCIERFGKIDGLVNNAGVVRPQPMIDETEEIIRRLIDINVYGTMFISVHAARAMVPSNSGSIVNISAGNHCGTPLFAAYGGSKGAVASLTYSWAMELQNHGIRVNALSPNAHTDMIDLIEEIVGQNPEPERQFPSPQDNAQVIVYLLSDRSANVNGQIVRVDADRVSLYGHPVVLHPSAAVDKFTVDAIARDFDVGVLSNMLQPLGIVTGELIHHGELEFVQPKQ